MVVVQKVFPYIEKVPGGGIVIGSTDQVLNWARKNSLWYMLFGLGGEFWPGLLRNRDDGDRCLPL